MNHRLLTVVLILIVMAAALVLIGRYSGLLGTRLVGFGVQTINNAEEVPEFIPGEVEAP